MLTSPAKLLFIKKTIQGKENTVKEIRSIKIYSVQAMRNRHRRLQRALFPLCNRPCQPSRANVGEAAYTQPGSCHTCSDPDRPIRAHGELTPAYLPSSKPTCVCTTGTCSESIHCLFSTLDKRDFVRRSSPLPALVAGVNAESCKKRFLLYRFWN